jgi:chloramphenicol 3-O-phosphotransferase
MEANARAGGVLNGTSSAGKTTLATAMQARLVEAGECSIILGIDDMFRKVPPAWVSYWEGGDRADDGFLFKQVHDRVEFRAGPVGRALLRAYQGWVAATARAGVDVLVDEVVLDAVAWAVLA